MDQNPVAPHAEKTKSLRERAEMLVRISEQTGLPLDNSGPPKLNEAIYQALQAAETTLR